MSIDLTTCDKRCHGCVKSYINKHKLKKGGKFEVIGCGGIPLQYVPDNIAATFSADPETVEAVLNPVLWASKYLDWHCLDPKGEHWKRKTAEGSLGGLPPYNPADPVHIERLKTGKSIFHRPYQAEMLECTSKRKIFRIGRQSGKTESLCIMIAYSIFTNEKFNVQVLTPYQSQIDLIFKRLNELIESNPILLNSRKRSVKAPQYTIELKNGSQVIGFTAGTNSKQEAGASRGQHANMLVFDEADYLSPADIEAALAVIINYPDATVWMSSTPTGRREKFFDSCIDPKYREFHYPSHVNPNWSDELEEYFKSEYTEDGYKHEILAEFGEQEEGVYQAKYVEMAQSEYEYGNMAPQPTWNYMIGVDWNDVKIGTTIAVIGYNPANAMFYLVEKHIVSRGERTQLAACQKIAEINRVWNATSIYVDQGYGATQIEVLHDFGGRALRTHGPNHPDARLRNIVKGYDFGSSIEIKDLFTKQPVKKPAKPFLVENSVRRFEQLQIKYPKSDKSLTAQLLGYIVDRISMTGRPSYKAQNEKFGDHFLDAVNLALVAFTLEKSHFGRVTYSHDIAMSGNFGESLDPKEVKKPENYKPKHSRTEHFQNDVLIPTDQQQLPLANTNQETQVRVWAWPGFLSDKPPPTSRKGLLNSKGRRGRPKRAKF